MIDTSSLALHMAYKEWWFLEITQSHNLYLNISFRVL